MFLASALCLTYLPCTITLSSLFNVSISTYAVHQEEHGEGKYWDGGGGHEDGGEHEDGGGEQGKGDMGRGVWGCGRGTWGLRRREENKCSG
jgi:hypothetical protein